MSTPVFLSYARGDDGEPFDPATSFVARLNRDLTKAGFDVWFDRVSMPSRSLTFHQEIRDAIARRERVVLVVGPNAATSEYVQQEWQFAWREADKVVTPILRWGDYPLVPDELKLLHCEDFRDDSQYSFHLKNLVRQLREPTPPLGKLIAVPSLPAHYLLRAERLHALRDALRVDLDRPVVIGGSVSRVGMRGMGGIGKSVLAAALARDRRVREAFSDGIVWVGLGQAPDLRALMQRVHQDLGGHGAIASEHEGKQRLKELLSEKAVRLMLDDAWRRSDVDAFDVLGSRCRALVTTRDAWLLTALGGIHHVVELLRDDEARRLLAVAAGVTEEALPEEAAAVVAECGRLPLAVALCGALVRRHMPWKSVLEQLQQARIDRIADRHAVELQHQTIWHAIHVSVAALTPAERERFLELAVFPEDETTPEPAIATLWEHTLGLDNWNSAELLTTLTERSLIQMTLPVPSSSGDPRRFSLHDLVFDYVSRATRDPVQLHTKLIDAYARKCADGWPSGPNDGYFLEHLRVHLLAAERAAELVELLQEPRWLEAKLEAALGHDILLDFALVRAATANDVTLLDRAVVERCSELGRLLGNVLDFVQFDPSSVTAQLLVELQEHSPQLLPTFRARWQVANRRRPWFERRSVARRYTIPSVAHTGHHQSYLHSLTFSADSRSLLYFDRQGGCVRWDWETGGEFQTVAPVKGGFVRSAAVASEQEILLTDETTLWLLRVPDVWRGDWAESTWLVLHRAETDHHLRALAACPDRGYAVFADDSETQGRLFQFRKGGTCCELAWRLPHAGRGGPLTNYVAFGESGKLRAIAFGSGDLAVNTGFHGRAHRGGIYEATFLAGRGLLATVGDDGTLALWDVRRGLVQRRDLLRGSAECVDYCPAADLLVVGHRSGAVTLLQFNGDNLSEEVLHPGVRGWVLCVRFSPCGRYLAVSGRNGTVRLFAIAKALEELRSQKELFQHMPQGPIEQAAYLPPNGPAFFLDQGEHLYSTDPSADSRHLPQKCETFCVGRQRGPVVLLTADVRFLDRTSGLPHDIHPLPDCHRLASALSLREDRLVVLESRRLVVYALDDLSKPPREVSNVAIDELRAAAGVAFSTQRNAVPLCVCDDGQTVALPLEPYCQASLTTDRTFSAPSLEHRLCLIEVATGRLLWCIPYQGFCNALVEVPSRRAVALGIGTGRVHLFDATGRQPQGSMFLPSDDPGVVIFSLNDGQAIGQLPVLAADEGVSALSSDARGVLLVGCRNGRVRAASLDDNKWLASVVLPAAVLAFAHQDSSLNFHAVDDGLTVGNWPVLHELLLWLPHQLPAIQTSEEGP